MIVSDRSWIMAGVCLVVLGGSEWSGAADALLPRGVKVVWDLAKARKQTTSTREHVCINGLWRWQPASHCH